MSEEKKKLPRIAGIQVDPVALAGKNIEELKKTEIFNHLPEAEQSAAYEELALATGLKKAPVVAPVKTDVAKEVAK